MDAHEGTAETWLERKRRAALAPSKVQNFRRTEAISIAIWSDASKVQPRSAWQLEALFQGFAPRSCLAQFWNVVVKKHWTSWGKPPQPTPKSQCCFHFQLKEDCNNSKWNPIGIHIQEHNKFTIEEQAATVTIAWCIHPPESDHLSPNHLWDETCMKGAGRAGGRHGKNTGCAKNVGLSVLPEKPCTTVLLDPRCKEALTSYAQSATIDKTRTASPRLEARNTGSSAWNKTGILWGSRRSKARAQVAPKDGDCRKAHAGGSVSWFATRTTESPLRVTCQ